jgi:replicative DNA helicase
VLSRIVAPDFFDYEITIIAERSLLGALLERPQLWEHCAPLLTADDFCLGIHRNIWQIIDRLDRAGLPRDAHCVATQLRGPKDVTYLAALVDGTLLDDFARYVQQVRTSARLRRAQLEIEQLHKMRSVGELRASLKAISEILDEGEGQCR